MKLIFTVRSDAAITAANEIIQEWKDESAGYYDTPHGMQKVLHGGAFERCGYAATLVATPSTWASPVTGHRWLTNGGNDHRIGICGDSVVFLYSGRRHGMRQEFRKVVERFWRDRVDEIYLSREQGWDPWYASPFKEDGGDALRS